MLQTNCKVAINSIKFMTATIKRCCNVLTSSPASVKSSIDLALLCLKGLGGGLVST